MGADSRTLAIRLRSDSRSLAGLDNRAAIYLGALRLRCRIAVPHHLAGAR